MSVDVESLSLPDFLMLLRYEGKPPPDPEFDNIRMTPQEWAQMFPGATQTEEVAQSDAAVPAPAPAAT